MKNFSIKKTFAVLLIIVMIITSLGIQGETAYAALKTVKSVSLKIGTKNVTKKTFKMMKGKSKKLKVVVKPIASKKSIIYRSKNKKLVQISKKGILKAKKVGTTKIIVKVKDKKGKIKKTWVKIKVTKIKNKKINNSIPDNNIPEINISENNSTTSTPIVSEDGTSIIQPEDTKPKSEITNSGGFNSSSNGNFNFNNSNDNNSPARPHQLSIDISNVDYDDESKKIVTKEESITLTGTVIASDKLKSISVEYKGYGEKEKTNKVNGTTNWFTTLPLQIGTNIVDITAYDTTGHSVKEEVFINRVNEVIHYDDNVKLADADDYKALEQGMVACWIDDNKTLDDDTDDSIVVLVKDNSLLLSQIKQGLLKPDNVYMIPENDVFVTGFLGIYKGHQSPRGTEDYPLSEYPDDTYEEIIFGYAGFGDLFSEDVSLDFSKGIDVNDPISFVMLPDGTCIDPVIDTEAKFKKSSINTKSSSSNNNNSKYNNDDKDKDDKSLIGNELYPQAGWQLQELGKKILPTIKCNFDQYNRANIGLNWKDIVIYDHDGVKNNFDVKYGQIKLSGEIGVKNLTYTGGIEWHSDLDVLPQQIISKLQYDYEGSIKFECDASVTTEELIKGFNNNFDNETEFWGLKLSGVNSLNSKLVIGAVGLNLVPPSTIVGNSISSLAAASKLTLSPSIILIFFMDLDGKISAEGAISFEYETSVEKGFNIQKNGYTGSYGSQVQNSGEQHFDIGNSYGLDVYDKNEGNFTLSFGGKVEATADIGLGVGAGLMIGGFCPAMMDAEVFYRASGLVEGEIDFLPEFKLNGYASLYQGFGVQADLSAKIKSNFHNLGFDINKHFEHMFWEGNWSNSSLIGTVYVFDRNTDNSNNEKIRDASVTLIKNDTGAKWETKTDLNGKYEFNSIPNGEYTLKISKTGFNEYIDSKFIFSKHKEFDVFLDKQEPSVINSILSGMVTEADSTGITNNTPLKGVNIIVKLISGSANVTKMTTTDSTGKYSIADLPVGLYEVKFVKDGYISVTHKFEVSEGVENYYNTIIKASDNNTDEINDVAALKEIIMEQKALGAEVSDDIMNSSQYGWDDSGRLIYIDWTDVGLTGKIDFSKLTALQKLNCGRLELDSGNNLRNNLSMLDISKNTDLRYLYCDNNKLTTLDISNNTALINLRCDNNKLTTLDTSKNIALTSLYCSYNQLRTLDISNNTALTSLDCLSNQLTTLDISRNTKLLDLDCSSNQLTALDTNNNTVLGSLDCSGNQLTALDISRNTKLLNLDCSNNQLTALDVSQNIVLRYLDCRFNELTELDVSKNIDLRELFCDRNRLRDLDISNNIDLVCLWCNQNLLVKLDISNNTNLIELIRDDDVIIIKNKQDDDTNNVDDVKALKEIIVEQSAIFGAKISTDINNSQYEWNSEGRLISIHWMDKKLSGKIDFSKLTALQSLDCGENNLSDLDISKNTALTRLDCGNNQLTSLDVSQNAALTKLSCDNNQLTSLDVSRNADLIDLDCEKNDLNVLNIGENTSLVTLRCGYNELTTLDVSKDSSLTTLYCWNNNLTTLDVSKNIALEELSCGQNKLEILDVSKNIALTKLDCYENHLAILNVDQNTNLISLSCYDNQLTSLDVSQNVALTELNCFENLLTLLDISNNIFLAEVSFEYNQLTSLDISKNTALKSLSCANNQLETLDLSKNVVLESLYCDQNKLTSLDISKNTALKSLSCANNQLKTLDLSKNVVLESLHCDQNKLTSLDISKNTALISLFCSQNQLTSLDVSRNITLERLICSGNRIQELDLRNNKALIMESLICDDTVRIIYD